MPEPRIISLQSREGGNPTSTEAIALFHDATSLQNAVDAHHGRFEQHAMLFLGERAPDDDVDVPRLVLERDERDAFCRTRMLAHGDEPRAAHALAVARCVGGGDGRRDATSRKLLADERERVVVERKALRRVVGHDVLAQRWLAKIDRTFANRSARKHRQRHLGAGAVPTRAIPMSAETPKRAGVGEPRTLRCAGACTTRHVGDVGERHFIARGDETLREFLG